MAGMEQHCLMWTSTHPPIWKIYPLHQYPVHPLHMLWLETRKNWIKISSKWKIDYFTCTFLSGYIWSVLEAFVEIIGKRSKAQRQSLKLHKNFHTSSWPFCTDGIVLITFEEQHPRCPLLWQWKLLSGKSIFWNWRDKIPEAAETILGRSSFSWLIPI